ncbi:MAG: hypothetical protein ACXWTS_04310 [Methylococcaceae bacterium]
MNQIIIAIVSLLVVVLLIQSYMMFQLNEWLNKMICYDNEAENPQIEIPKLPNPTILKPSSDDGLQKDHPLEYLQRNVVSTK